MQIKVKYFEKVLFYISFLVTTSVSEYQIKIHHIINITHRITQFWFFGETELL